MDKKLQILSFVLLVNLFANAADEQIQREASEVLKEAAGSNCTATQQILNAAQSGQKSMGLQGQSSVDKLSGHQVSEKILAGILYAGLQNNPELLRGLLLTGFALHAGQLHMDLDENDAKYLEVVALNLLEYLYRKKIAQAEMEQASNSTDSKQLIDSPETTSVKKLEAAAGVVDENDSLESADGAK